jgi:hypothetical protein
MVSKMLPCCSHRNWGYEVIWTPFNSFTAVAGMQMSNIQCKLPIFFTKNNKECTSGTPDIFLGTPQNLILQRSQILLTKIQVSLPIWQIYFSEFSHITKSKMLDMYVLSGSCFPNYYGLQYHVYNKVSMPYVSGCLYFYSTFTAYGKYRWGRQGHSGIRWNIRERQSDEGGGIHYLESSNLFWYR